MKQPIERRRFNTHDLRALAEDVVARVEAEAIEQWAFVPVIKESRKKKLRITLADMPSRANMWRWFGTYGKGVSADYVLSDLMEWLEEYDDIRRCKLTPELRMGPDEVTL